MNFYFFSGSQVNYDTTTKKWSDSLTSEDICRYLKMRWTNKSRFKSRFIDEANGMLPNDKDLNELLDVFLGLYDNVSPYTYKDSFAITSDDFRSLVFGSISVPNMIKELGHKRVSADGAPVKHKQFSPSGEFTGYKEYDVVYEVHEVNCKGLGLDDNAYALRCWCTTTNEEHWLWIDDTYKNDPLEAVARTFFVNSDIIPYIKEIKRQGDVLLVELTEEIEPKGEMVSLSKEQYFKFLTAQS